MSFSPRVLSAILNAVDEGIYHTDLDRRILYWNASAQRMTGYEASAVQGCRCQDRILRHVDALGTELCNTPECPLLVAIRTGKTHRADLFLHHLEGHLVPVSVRTEPCFEDGVLTGATQFLQERSSSGNPRSRGHDWKRAALTDSLTGLGNRRAFRLAWGRAHRALLNRSAGFGVLLIDLDHFKGINDTHGHGVGDRVLKMVGRTLTSGVRPQDTVIRWGGEEFLIILPRSTPETLADLAERVRMLIEKGWVILPDSSHLRVTASVGGSMVRLEDRAADAVARADARLFECKDAGRNRSLTGP